MGITFFPCKVLINVIWIFVKILYFYPKMIKALKILVFISLLSSNAFADGDKPLELINFMAVQNLNKVDIRWSTSVETGGPYFTIEKSKDGKEFTKLVDIPLIESGTTYSDYFETDYQPYNGVSYYRIKQTDEAGNFRYSQTITFKYEEQLTEVPLVLNKKDNGKEKLSDKNAETLLVLRDANGNDYYSVVSIDPTNNNTLIAHDMSSSISIGTYHIIGSSTNELYNQKVIVK